MSDVPCKTPGCNYAMIPLPSGGYVCTKCRSVHSAQANPKLAKAVTRLDVDLLFRAAQYLSEKGFADEFTRLTGIVPESDLAKAACPTCGHATHSGPCLDGDERQMCPCTGSQEEAAEPRADGRLKTCPHCGALGWLERHGGIFQGAIGYRVECLGTCHSMTCYWHTETQAIEAWNMRPDDACPVSPQELRHYAKLLNSQRWLAMSRKLNELSDWLERGRV